MECIVNRKQIEVKEGRGASRRVGALRGAPMDDR
jgi:hypothetical protein